MKQLPLSKLQSLFAAVSAAQTLYIPADDAAGQASFTVWQEGIALTKKLNTVRSAKDLFFPQVENLVGFRASTLADAHTVRPLEMVVWYPTSTTSPPQLVSDNPVFFGALAVQDAPPATGEHPLAEGGRLQRAGLAELDRQVLVGEARDEGAMNGPEAVGIRGRRRLEADPLQEARL